MFKVLKGLLGNRNICMPMRVVTDFNVFWYWTIRICLFVFLTLPFWVITKCSSVLLPFNNLTGTTLISDYLRIISACRLHCCSILQTTNNSQLATVQHKLNKASGPRVIFSKYHTVLTHTVIVSVELLLLILPYWFPVILCLFCVCFSHCTKCKNK